jgi:hypothetical protein
MNPSEQEFGIEADVTSPDRGKVKSKVGKAQVSSDDEDTPMQPNSANAEEASILSTTVEHSF